MGSILEVGGVDLGSITVRLDPDLELTSLRVTDDLLDVEVTIVDRDTMLILDVVHHFAEAGVVLNARLLSEWKLDIVVKHDPDLTLVVGDDLEVLIDHVADGTDTIASRILGETIDTSQDQRSFDHSDVARTTVAVALLLHFRRQKKIGP